MNFQEQKRLLEKYLGGRLISDAVFYRIKRDLKVYGIGEEQYQSTFPLIGQFNLNRRGIVIPPEKILKLFSGLKNSQVQLTCKQFQEWLEKGMTHKPNARKVKNKSYLSPTWYQWFVLAGIPYEKSTIYPFEKYLIVASHALIWDLRKLKSNTIDAEIVNPN
jgi:hypothetical protein